LEAKLKKQLLTTTALVVAGALVASGSAFAKKKKATKPVWTLGGGWEMQLGIVDDNSKEVGDKGGVDVRNSAEIHFGVNHKLDNGIKIKGKVEMEGNTSTDQVDEAFFSISGSFGEIRVGSEDPVTDLMVASYAGSLATDVGNSTHIGVAQWHTTPTGFIKATGPEVDAGSGDAEKIAYFTPRIEGFQVAVGYMPNAQEDESGATPLNTAARHDGYAIAANYNTKIDKISIGVAAGYVTMKHVAGFNTPEKTQNDPAGVTAGIKVSSGGLKLAVGYGNKYNERGATTDNSAEVLSYGAQYKWGAHGVSIAYVDGETIGLNETAGEDKTELLNLAYSRTLGPGVAWRTNLAWADYEGEDTTITTDDADSFSVVTGLKLSF
jgi:outer membrane protein OmpU